METTVSPRHFQEAVKLCVIELEHRNPFSSRFSLSIAFPFRVAERGECAYFLKADTTLEFMV